LLRIQQEMAEFHCTEGSNQQWKVKVVFFS